MEFEDLPEELKLIAASNMDRESLLNMCQSNRQWYKLCQDQHLWRDLFERDFGRKTITANPYQEYRILYIALKNVEKLYYPIFRKNIINNLLNLSATVKSMHRGFPVNEDDLEDDSVADAINDSDIFFNIFNKSLVDDNDEINDLITNFAYKMNNIIE